ncbi:hypothetical protein BDZ91DRAFT_414165 [Kalaharituber pfeilii]|nr:hypothetical protein BDZ91DRAFT_414165 [Kalaharituber pfeilii]
MSSSTAHEFTLLVPPHIQQVQLLGSWDNYARRYDMAPSRSSPGLWRLNIKFPETGSSGSKRYWFYYILDGYFESHDPNMPTTKEPTRGITLNVLDLVRSGSSSPVSTRSSTPERMGARPLTIIAPKPRNPMAHHALTYDASERPYSTYSDVATIASSSPRSFYCSSPSSCSDSDIESPITPIDYFSDDEVAYASDSSVEFTHSVRPSGKYALKSKRYGQYDLAAEMGKVRIVN